MFYKETDNDFIIDKNVCPPDLLQSIKETILMYLRDSAILEKYESLRENGIKSESCFHIIGEENFISPGRTRNIIYEQRKRTRVDVYTRENE